MEGSASLSTSQQDLNARSNDTGPNQVRISEPTLFAEPASLPERKARMIPVTKGSGETPTQQPGKVSENTSESVTNEASRSSTDSATDSEGTNQASTRRPSSQPASNQAASREPGSKKDSGIDAFERLPDDLFSKCSSRESSLRKKASEEVFKSEELNAPAKPTQGTETLGLREFFADKVTSKHTTDAGEEANSLVRSSDKKPPTISRSLPRRLSSTDNRKESEELKSDGKGETKVHWLERPQQHTITTNLLDEQELELPISVFTAESSPDSLYRVEQTPNFKRGDNTTDPSTMKAELEYAEQDKGMADALLNEALHPSHAVAVSNNLQKELLLYPLALLLFIVMVAVILLIQWPRMEASANKHKRTLIELCLSGNCIRDADYLGDLLSWSVSPCDDFYKFVCGRWTNRYPISGDNSVVSADDDAIFELEDKLYERLQKNENAPQPLKKLFDHCVDQQAINYTSLDNLLELLFQVSLQGFPFTPPVRSSTSVWKIAAKILRKTGAATLLSTGIGYHPAHPKIELAGVGLPDAPLGVDGTDISKAIADFNKTSFSCFKVLNKQFLPHDYKEEVVGLGRGIENIYRLTSRDPELKVFRVSSNSPLQEFLSEAFTGVQKPTHTDANSEILVESAEYVSRLVKLVNNTQVHTVMNYLGVRLMVQMAEFLPTTELPSISNSLLQGYLRPAMHRGKFCLRAVEKAMPHLFHEFATADLNQSLSKISKFVSHFLRDFVHAVQAQSFLNNVSKSHIRRLIERTQLEIMGQSWTRQKKLLDQYTRHHPQLSNTSTAFESYVMAHEYNFVSSLTQRSTTRWRHSVLSASCWYERWRRTIHIPALLFNQTLLSDTRLKPLGLSQAAIRIGRSMFDMVLLENRAVDVFDQRLDTQTRSGRFFNCFGDSDNAQWTASLGDAWATSIAYAVFQWPYNGLETTIRLKVANQQFHSRQLFFVYMMLRRCEITKNGEPVSSPLSGRSKNSALRNVRGFSESYLCPPGSPMSPATHCAL